MRNIEIREGLNMKSMRERVKRRRLLWYGYVEKIGEERLPKMMEEMGVDRRRPRARPKSRRKEGEVNVERRGHKVLLKN